MSFRDAEVCNCQLQSAVRSQLAESPRILLNQERRAEARRLVSEIREGDVAARGRYVTDELRVGRRGTAVDGIVNDSGLGRDGQRDLLSCGDCYRRRESPGRSPRSFHAVMR